MILRELKDWLEFFISHIPGRTGYFFRSFYYAKLSSRSFKNIRFETGLRIEYPKNIELGSDSYFGLNCKLYASEFSSLKIGLMPHLIQNI